jgi:hypothetical protein
VKTEENVQHSVLNMETVGDDVVVPWGGSQRLPLQTTEIFPRVDLATEAL